MVRPRLRPGTGLDALAFFDVGLSWEGGVGEKISFGSFPERLIPEQLDAGCYKQLRGGRLVMLW